MNSRLRLTFAPDDDGTGELSVSVSVGSFSGSSSAWFAHADLVAFGQSLARAYPLQAGNPIELQGGYWGQSGNVLEQLHVGLRFYPVGSLGTVGCRVQLATPLQRGNRPDQQSSIAVELLTSYEQVRAFAQALVELAQGQTDVAVLNEYAG